MNRGALRKPSTAIKPFMPFCTVDFYSYKLSDKLKWFPVVINIMPQILSKELNIHLNNCYLSNTSCLQHKRLWMKQKCAVWFTLSWHTKSKHRPSFVKSFAVHLCCEITNSSRVWKWRQNGACMIWLKNKPISSNPSRWSAAHTETNIQDETNGKCMKIFDGTLENVTHS